MTRGRWAAAAGLALALLGWLYYDGRLNLNEPRAGRYPVRGLDVSHHQGDIDWPRLQDSGLSFVYIKASEGGDHRDRLFEANWRGAARAGVPAGAYHFYTFCKGGTEQAENFLAALAPVSGPMLPPAVDLEFVGNCRRRPPHKELKLELDAFVSRVKGKLGRRPVFYVTSGFLKAYGAVLPAGAEIWIRSVFFSPSPPWTFWQYADHGRLPGISGLVDLNVFNGSAQAWEAFKAPPAPPAPPAKRGP